MIDAATPGHPVFVNRLDGHMALANTLALQLAGITRETTDPAGGLIVRDPATGEPTGILKDAAQTLVERAAPIPSFEEKLAAARKTTLLKVDASDCATGFFAMRGYEPVQRNMVFLGDEVLGNTTMTKKLAADTGQTQ